MIQPWALKQGKIGDWGKGNLLFLHDMDLRNRLPWARRQGLRGDEIKGFVAILTRAVKSDICRKNLVGVNIGCFMVSRCVDIVYWSKNFRLYRCHCDGVGLFYLTNIGIISSLLLMFFE